MAKVVLVTGIIMTFAVGTVAAVAFAVVLYKIVRSPAVSSALSSIVNHALHAL